MFRVVGRLLHKVFELATRRILREALASAIVTIIVTAAFTGFAPQAEPPMPRAVVAQPPAAESAPVETKPVAAAAPAPGPATVDYARVWFDPKAVAPHPTTFRRVASVALAPPSRPTHKRAPAMRQAAATATPRPIVQASARLDERSRNRAPDALAAPPPVPEKHGFRVWGVAPSDLIPSVPSASSIMKGVKSVGTSVAGLMPSL